MPRMFFQVLQYSQFATLEIKSTLDVLLLLSCGFGDLKIQDSVGLKWIQWPHQDKPREVVCSDPNKITHWLYRSQPTAWTQFICSQLQITWQHEGLPPWKNILSVSFLKPADWKTPISCSEVWLLALTMTNSCWCSVWEQASLLQSCLKSSHFYLLSSNSQLKLFLTLYKYSKSRPYSLQL